MRRQTSLTRLTSRQRFFGAVAVAGGAVAALGGSLNAPWLVMFGPAITVGAAFALIPLAFWQGLAERSLEKAQTSNRLLVPVGVIGKINPTSIGVDAAAQNILDGGIVPTYVLRNSDAELQGAVADALAGDPNPWIVVVNGQSKVGKSRSLFEALSRCAQAETLELVAPKNGAALIALLTDPDALPDDQTPAVLWLDDLEPILNEDVTFATLQEWRNGGNNRIVAATCGGKGGDSVAGSATAGLQTNSRDVFTRAKQVHLAETTADEIAAIIGNLAPAVQAAIEEHGLAAFLVAGSQLELKLNTGFHVVGEERCPEGVAVVHAAVDWARCGRTDPIDREALRKLWVSYLSSGTFAMDEVFDKGLEWACRPVAGTIALLQGRDKWKAFDYVVRVESNKTDASPPRDASWVAAIDTARDTQALSVGVTAYRHDRLKDALAAFERASSSDIAAVVANALVNKGVALAKTGDTDGAIAACDDAITRFADATESPLREVAARALFNKGVALGETGDPKGEIAAYDEVITRFADATESPLRDLVEQARQTREELRRRNAM